MSMVYVDARASSSAQIVHPAPDAGQEGPSAQLDFAGAVIGSTTNVDLKFHGLRVNP